MFGRFPRPVTLNFRTLIKIVPQPLAILPGDTEFAGSCILCIYPGQDYNVSIVKHSEATAEILHNDSAPKAIGKELICSFVIVPYVFVPSVFDNAAKDVDCMIHYAIPVFLAEIPREEHESHFVDTAINGTLIPVPASSG